MSLPTYFRIPSLFLQYLQHVPCDIYKLKSPTDNNNFEILFTIGTQLEDEIVSQTILSNSELYVLSKHRLKFVNSFSEQIHSSLSENENYEVVTKENLFYANKQMDKISSKLRDVGVDQEVIDMSQINLARILEIAKNAPDLSKLVSILVSNDNSFRLKESQLLTYMTFHVLKILNMWTEKKMQAVLREHHGSISGRGFCDEISSFSPLSKIFFLTQKWVYQVLTTEEKNIQHQSLIKNLKNDFSDSMSIKIIDALALVEVNEILHALTADLQEQEDKTLKKENIVNSVVDELTGNTKEEDSKLETDSSLAGMINSIKNVSSFLQNNDLKKYLSSENFESLNQLSFFITTMEYLPASDKIEVITGVAMVLEESVQKINSIKDPNTDIDNTKKTIKSVTKNIEDIITVVKGKFSDNLDELIKVRSRNSKTLLMIASQLASVESVKLLLEGGADLKTKDSFGKTSLHYAAIGGNLDIVKIFVSLGASIGNLYSLSKLASLKVPLNSFDYKGRNAYFFAKSKGRKEIMLYLQANVKGLQVQ
ncbi:MAG: ankyrin repeat domain-containing protein [Oligoflexia bacterium]|nr:ankyrin repeat domain-containing protein [Oligoflexia bacterium]